jgi:nitrite reductase/ring-hydroxylating ferredoxin subunit
VKATRRLVLTTEQSAAISAGRFIRVDLGAVVAIGVLRVRSILVGRTGGGIGVLAAYLNVCAHQAVPLDVGADSPMSDDGYHLLCHQHGAIYRPNDGYCVSGPCKGESLVRVAIESVSPDGRAIDVSL